MHRQLSHALVALAVPLVFAGGGVRVQRIARTVEPAYIAPALSALVGAKRPSGACGAVLHGVLAAG